jgi:hypothetical protein
MGVITGRCSQSFFFAAFFAALMACASAAAFAIAR